jgi:hypothetical protein
MNIMKASSFRPKTACVRTVELKMSVICSTLFPIEFSQSREHLPPVPFILLRPCLLQSHAFQAYLGRRWNCGISGIFWLWVMH